MMVVFRSASDDRIEYLTRVHVVLSHALENVRPTDALMTLARKTLAWAERRAGR